MSEPVDDVKDSARQLLAPTKGHPLTNAMREFLEQHESPSELKELRRRTSGGTPLEEIVEGGRRERIE